MLHRFSFSGGRVGYRSRFLDSNAYRDAKEKGKIVRSEFATDPCTSLFGRAMTLFKGEAGTDNANVNVTELAGRTVSMTETPMPLAFDRDTLETVDHVTYDDHLSGDVTTAHPLRDPARGCVYNYLLKFGATNRCAFYRQDDRSQIRQQITEVRMDRAPYMHSFAQTRDYLILTQFPLTVNPLDLLRSGKPFIENYRWQPERGTIFTVIEKDTGKVVGNVEVEPFFAFHHVNGFEDGVELVVDLAAYPDASIIDQLYLDKLRGEGTEELAGRLVRFRLDLRSGTARREMVSGQSFELPRINPARAPMRDYDFVWANGHSQQQNFVDQITKIDIRTGEARVWMEPGHFPGEPVFVERPDAETEDDGVLLSVVLDANMGRSFLLVLDAATLDEIGRANVPKHIPFSFHGQFFASEKPAHYSNSSKSIRHP
jgi:carotenoid cleavage dioxygenase-like enzyme